jgi:hypothetical protein
VVLAVLALKVRIWFNYIVILQDIMGLVAELQLKALAKVLIALFQVTKLRPPDTAAQGTPYVLTWVQVGRPAPHTHDR